MLREKNNMKKNKIGIIGGSGVYDLAQLTDKKWQRINTNFGEPSDELLFGKIGEYELVFLPRHGRGHKNSPTSINFRANIEALKIAGVSEIISVSAVGSLSEKLAPGAFVIVDQFIDRTFAREKSFFGKGCVAHVSMAKPTCSRLSTHILIAGKNAGINIINGGTYLAMEGPQFSSVAESKLYQSWGCDVIGMTNMPEAKLAREAEICYVSVAMVTDYDCWHPDHEAVSVEQVIKILLSNAETARKLVSSAISLIGDDSSSSKCSCKSALDYAIITAAEARDPELTKKLVNIAGRVL